MQALGRLWRRWTWLCGAGEMLGFAAVAAPGWLILHFIGPSRRLDMNLLEIGIMLLTGVAEGLIIGLFQWFVLRDLFPNLTRKDWLLTTAVGSALAWGLGTLPAVALTTRSAHGDPHAGMVLLFLSALLGLLLGAVFGGFQWLELQKHSPMAAAWIPANALAWCLGSVLLYGTTAAMGHLPAESWLWLLLGTALAGLVVGAVTGLGLLAMAQRGPSESRIPSS